MRSILIAGVASGALSHAAVCAQAPSAAPEPPALSAPAAASQEAASEIIVTGSRTIRNGAAAPTPVTTLTSQALTQTAPSNIPDALNRLPQFLGSSSQYRSTTFNATAGLQGNYLNLRGLGPQRVLVLIDGNRVPPTATSNAVDSNIMPQMLIERVDVVTGGASAAYGSDAVSGVVNYILNKNFNGVQASAQRGVSTYGDAGSYRLGVAAGQGFAGDHGHIEASVEHYRNDGIPSQSQRPDYSRLALITGTGAANNPYTLVTNARFNDVTFGGLIRSGPLAGSQFNPDGTASPFTAGAPTGTSQVTVGGQGAVVPPTVLVPKLETTQAFGRASYEFTDTINGFVQGGYSRSKTGYLSAFATRRAGTSNGITIFADNPYLSPSVRTALGAAPSFTMSRLFSDAPGNEQTSLTQSYNVMTGLEGTLGGLHWDVNYTHGRAQLDLSQVEQNNRNFYAAVDAVRAPSGQIVCRVTLVNPAFGQGCVPINVMGLGNLDPAALAYIRQDSRSRIVNRLDVVGANLRGDLFDLPAGPVAFAIGGEARWQKLRQTSNADPSIAVDYTGIRGVPSGVLPFATTNVGAARGSQDVKEGYAELNVPIFKDQPFAKRLELNGAFRYTDYKTSGSVKTWKVGGIYEPMGGIRLRLTASRDIAAPSLFDLFAGQQAQVGTNTDRHTGVTSLSTIVSSGNASLQPERANTLVGGLVLQPSFIPRLTFSIDAYRIAIKDAIGSQDAQTELNDCELSGGTAPVCALITRPFPYSNTTPANFPTTIVVAPQNLSALRVKGIDFEVNYTVPLEPVVGIGGNLDLRAFVSYLDSYQTKANATANFIERAGRVTTVATTAGLPKWRGLVQQAYRNGGLTIQLTERFTGSYRRTTTEAFDPAFVEAPNKIYTDLYVSQGFDQNRYSLFVQVDNLFNVKPPLLPATVNPGFTYPTDKQNYDIVGRVFTIGAKARF
ncbi:TonB-dependent receptor [Sphingomonas sp. AP4-R1]|uniref:TonB-dependent receptor domain-containing protein n=1 Tax=Sphingomonas sp. AP4-R1 TaxID=2735134 RepID=UPI0014937020|nr:TonB-dependent receptor [Sphingomonas sp. AP4-R1]QJU58315.1 TonB-dependent receptor [Sphingomonas sp. AP4-R1]